MGDDGQLIQTLFPWRKTMSSRTVVTESQSIVKELTEVRKEFREGKHEPAQARNLIGIYNVSCRAVGTQIQSEKWQFQKTAMKMG